MFLINKSLEKIIRKNRLEKLSRYLYPTQKHIYVSIIVFQKSYFVKTSKYVKKIFSKSFQFTR